MSACGNGKKDSLIGWNDGRDEVEKVYFYITLDTGNGHVRGLVTDREKIEISKTYEDAIIMINGVKIDSQGGVIDCIYEDLKLEVGDEVVFIIHHQLLDTIKETLIVPDCPEGIYVDGNSMNDFLMGNIESITLYWDKIDCDRYYFERFLNGRREPVFGFVDENHVTLYDKHLYIEKDGEMKKANSVTIQIQGENNIFYETTFGTVDLRVYSPAYVSISAGE